MTSWQDITPDTVIHEGEAWGSLQERISGKKIPGLLFTAPLTDKEKPWYELITENNFSKDTLNKDPISWNVSATWQKLIQESIDAGKNTWLHNLHLAAVYMEQKNTIKAKEYFETSNKLKSNFQSLRGLAIIELANNNFDEGIELYMKAWKDSNSNHDLFIELSKILMDKNKVSHLKELVKGCPKGTEKHEYLNLSKALIALDDGKYEEARKHLVREYIYVREGNTITTNIWFNSFYLPEEKKIGRSLTDAEKENIRAKNPPPNIIDFQMKE